MALNKIPEEWKGTKVIGTLGGNQTMRILNEAGIYKLIMRSNKDIADTFQKWVCGDVLPNIRKKGEYKMNESYQQKLKELEEQKENVEKLLLKKDEQIKKYEEKHKLLMVKMFVI
jgi:prophage antirepressor-like protein